jgi:hypothetical protein
MGGTARRAAWAVVIIGAILAVVMVAYVAFLFVVHDFNRDFLRIDDCLDDGGRWDYPARACDHSDPK